MNKHEIVLEWDKAEILEALTSSKKNIDLSVESFEETLESGRIVGWIMAEEIFFEDFDLPEYDGVDLPIADISIVSVAPQTCTLKIRARVIFELDPEITTDTQEERLNFFNAVSGGIQLFFLPEKGGSPHPEEATDVYEVNGEMNLVQVNGHTIHERRD